MQIMQRHAAPASATAPLPLAQTGHGARQHQTRCTQRSAGRGRTCAHRAGQPRAPTDMTSLLRHGSSFPDASAHQHRLFSLPLFALTFAALFTAHTVSRGAAACCVRLMPHRALRRRAMEREGGGRREKETRVIVCVLTPPFLWLFCSHHASRRQRSSRRLARRRRRPPPDARPLRQQIPRKRKWGGREVGRERERKEW